MTKSLGVIIVTYNSAAEICACLDSLAIAKDIRLDVVVVDNASTDESQDVVERWLVPENMTLTLLKLPKNLGFAAGVNVGLKRLQKDPDRDRFWILNPDCTCASTTPLALANHPLPFSMLGCRITYSDPADQIQIDAGTVNAWTGATRNINLGQSASQTPPPDIRQADFISGASMVVSRQFTEVAGPMPEDYFLYYEEVDWASRRRGLPLAFCKTAQVAHKAGASIGSPTLARGPSEVSTYFKHRARLRFILRYHPLALPVAYAFGWAKIAQSVLRGQTRAALGAIRAIHGMGPSRLVIEATHPQHQAKANALTAETKLS